MLGRRFVGYDLDPDYVALARERVAAEGQLLELDEGLPSKARCLAALEGAGFELLGTDRRVPKTSVVVDAVVRDSTGATWHVEFGGAATAHRPGLFRPDAAFRSLGRLSALRGQLGPQAGLLLLTTGSPEPRSEAEVALRAAGPGLFRDLIDVGRSEDLVRLARYGAGETRALEGFWRSEQLG